MPGYGGGNSDDPSGDDPGGRHGTTGSNSGGGSNGNESMGGYGGFGGLGIGNPGSYGGQASVGAPGFSGGYGSDGGAYQTNSGAVQSVYDALYGVQKGKGMPKLAKTGLSTLMSAVGVPFSGLATTAIDGLISQVGRRNSTLDAMRAAGYTDQQLGQLLGDTAVSLMGNDQAAMWGTDEWNRQFNNAVVGKYHADQWTGGQASGSTDSTAGADTAGTTGGLAGDWRAFEENFGGMGDQIYSDYQDRMSNLPQLDLKLPGRMGGGMVPMAPGKWAQMYGDQAKTESGIMDRMADINATGIGGRQDIWKTSEQIKNQQNMQERAIDASEPSAWASWAPVVGSAVDTIFDTDWGDVADTISGWF